MVKIWAKKNGVVLVLFGAWNVRHVGRAIYLNPLINLPTFLRCTIIVRIATNNTSWKSAFIGGRCMWLMLWVRRQVWGVLCCLCLYLIWVWWLLLCWCFCWWCWCRLLFLGWRGRYGYMLLWRRRSEWWMIFNCQCHPSCQKITKICQSDLTRICQFVRFECFLNYFSEFSKLIESCENIENIKLFFADSSFAK